MKYLFVMLISMFTIVGCASLKPQTVTNAVVAHQTFPSLSMAVQDCVADYPDVRAKIVDPFNVLVDKWQAADQLEPDASLLVALAGAKNQVTEAKVAWLTVKQTIVDAGIDCGPAVVAQVQNIESTFGEIESAVLSNERIVYALEWGQLLANVVLGRRGEVVRM